MATKPKRPRDPFQLAKLIGDISTGQVPPVDEKQAATSEARRKVGFKGGTARAKNLTPDQRADIARIAAEARWKKRRP